MVDPVLIEIGSLQIRYYGILFALAVLVGYFIARRLAKEFGFNKDKVEDFVLYAVIVIVIGARLFEALFYNPEYYFSDPLKIFYVWEGGLASHGALIGLLILTYFYAKRNKISFYKIADLFVMPIALGAAFVRIGNFINGELVGKITSVPWAVEFAGYQGLRHPVQLYQAGYYILIFLILLKIRKLKNGTTFWMFLFLDGVFRFTTEFFKDLPADYGFSYLGLNLAQYASLILIVISIKPLYSRIKYYLPN